MSLYSADGRFNITVVDGTTYTGTYAVNGSYNVVATSGGTTPTPDAPFGLLALHF